MFGGGGHMRPRYKKKGGQMPEKDSVCTCAAEYPTAPCPEHGLKKNAPPQEYGKSVVVITDEAITSKEIDYLSGYRFTCQSCSIRSIFHFFNFCPECGVKILVQSETVRDVIRAINKKNGGE